MKRFLFIEGDDTQNGARVLAPNERFGVHLANTTVAQTASTASLLYRSVSRIANPRAFAVPNRAGIDAFGRVADWQSAKQQVGQPALR